ncbi:MAG: hypothetical protein V1936_01955 [Patescibacteria group bacterium]
MQSIAMLNLFNRFARPLLVASLILLGWGFVSSVQAGTYMAGDPFHHIYWIQNNANCDMRILSVRKSWESLNGSLTRVQDPKTGLDFYTQSGSTPLFVLPTPYLLKAHQRLDPGGYLNFWTSPSGPADTIRSTIEINYEFVLTEPCQKTGVAVAHVETYIVMPPVCGNNILDPGEQCDGTADTACPGSCRADCTCGGTSSSSSSGSSSSGSSSGGSSSGGSSSSSSGGGSSSGGSSSGGGGSSSSGGSCSFDLECSSLPIDCKLTTLKVENGEVAVPLNVSGSSCFDKSKVCVQVGSTPIVANHSQDVRAATFSDCLPQSSFDIVGNKLYIPAQNKSSYKIRVGTSPGAGQTCYFDTRVQPISGTGTNCSRAFASVADGKNICDTVYPEARTLMNPRIAQILQPFHEPGKCSPVQCANGKTVELCGCDATGKGVVLDSLDSLNKAIDYRDYSNSSNDKVNGEKKYLADCASGNVIFFDPPSGGIVTLDAPGDDFVLPPYPVTLVVRGADLRIADNLVYPKNSNASLGVILIKNDVCGATYGGDAFLHPKPTNVVGAYYLEGSVKSVDENWNLPTDRSNVRWYQTFKNQILWEGTILSLNSIGGAVDPVWPANDPNCPVSRRPYKIGGGFPDPSWNEAVEYDLAYLREYFKCGNLTSALAPYGSQNWKISSCDETATPYSEIAYDELNGREPALDTNAPEAVVLRYDSRIQNNPPPGFDSIADILQKALGL